MVDAAISPGRVFSPALLQRMVSSGVHLHMLGHELEIFRLSPAFAAQVNINITRKNMTSHTSATASNT